MIVVIDAIQKEKMQTKPGPIVKVALLSSGIITEQKQMKLQLWNE